MAVALAATSLFAAGGSAAAGASAAGTFMGISAGTFGAIGAAAGAGGQILQGLNAASESRAENSQLQLQAKAREIQSVTKENERRRVLLNTISSRNALFASRGVSINSGTPLGMNAADTSELNRANRIEDLNRLTDMGTTGLEMSINKRKASNAIMGGIIGGSKSLLDFGASQAMIGGPKTEAGG